MQGALVPVTVGTLLLAVVVSSVTATPPRPGTEGNGLTENESATLWTRDDDSGYISDRAFRDAYGESRTAVQGAANGTDLTFTEPPATASVWTRNDFADVPVTNRTASVYPRNATLVNGTYVRDAHATMFSITPSTTAHVDPNVTRRYVAPTGRVRGLVDYRVRTPPRTVVGDRTTTWSVLDTEIEEVRLRSGEEVVARTNGSHRPVLEYALDGGRTTLTLEADIETRLEKHVTLTRAVTRTLPNGTTRQVVRTVTNTTIVTDRVTVTDETSVTVYDLRAQFYLARYPDGDTGVAVFQNRPWQGYTLTANGSTRVRGVWRFYTARDTDWDVLTRSRANGTDRARSPALPVSVHAYPSKLGPRAEPTGVGPEITRRWGTRRSTPQHHLGENVTVDVVSDPYVTSWGLAVRTDRFDRDAIRIRGIVRGVNATVVTPPAESRRRIYASELSMTVVSQNATGATLRVSLRNASSGEPIVLSDPENSRLAPIAGDRRDGYITLAGRRIETNDSGVALVRVTESGVYTARYHPETWLTYDPAYVGDTATARWHPLTTVDGWFVLVIRTGQWFLPFLLALYAGRKLGELLTIGGTHQYK